MLIACGHRVPGVSLLVELSRDGLEDHGKGPPLPVGRSVRIGPVDQFPVVDGQVTRLHVNRHLVLLGRHIKIGNAMHPGRNLRIHFVFDSKREKFLIGHCGKHLPTASG